MREGQKRDAARALRHNATDAERIMWLLLRDRRLGGMKFRRQVPIGPFVADFASVQHRLVVELDGGHHADSAADARRDAFLTREGWRMLRFWNNDVMQNREGVLERILEVAALTPTLSRPGKRLPSPRPSPASGRGSSTAFAAHLSIHKSIFGPQQMQLRIQQ